MCSRSIQSCALQKGWLCDGTPQRRGRGDGVVAQLVEHLEAVLQGNDVEEGQCPVLKTRALQIKAMGGVVRQQARAWDVEASIDEAVLECCPVAKHPVPSKPAPPYQASRQAQ